MLEYDRIDISKGIDVNKTSLSKECATFGILKKCLFQAWSISLQWFSWFNAKSFEFY